MMDGGAREKHIKSPTHQGMNTDFLSDNTFVYCSVNFSGSTRVCGISQAYIIRVSMCEYVTQAVAKQLMLFGMYNCV